MQYLEWKETITFNRLIKFIDHISFFTESVFEIKSKTLKITWNITGIKRLFGGIESEIPKTLIFILFDFEGSLWVVY